MDLLERVLTERMDELADAVHVRTGMTLNEARRLVEEAGGDLVASYHWHGAELRAARLDSPLVARSVLEFIRGRTVARRVGLSTGRAWDGIRVLVPAVLQTAAQQQGGGDPSPETRYPEVGRHH